MKVINGNLVSDYLYSGLNKFLENKKCPFIVDISVGNDFGSLMYSKMKQKTISTKTNIEFKSVHFDSIEEEDLKKYIIELNNDIKVDGIMIQLPLPSNLKNNQQEILDTISVNKDVDGLTTYSMNMVEYGKYNFVPCTALAIDIILNCYSVRLKGRKVAIINRSNIVGKPLSYLLSRKFALPIICHSQTESLSSITKECDVVVAALNKQEYITSDYVKEGATIIDVGVHKNEFGKTVGDVLFDDVLDKCSYITPSVGGVGPVTICMLAYNVSKAVYGEIIYEVLNNSVENFKNNI